MTFLTKIIQNFAKSYAHKTMQNSLLNSLNIDISTNEIKKTPKPGKKYMLYAHIPFCHTFCPYCSFHKYAYERDLCKIYFQNLRQEMVQIKNAGYDFYAMYVGGGTTLIDEDELLKTLELAKMLFNIKEISCESDPNHIEPAKLQKFRGIIDRLSVGVQSFDNEILKKISRFEKFGSSEILQIKLKNAAGILPILSIDLIFNFPFQTKQNLLNDIKISKSINAEQITFYPLMKSPLTRDLIAKNLGISAVDNEEEFYKIIRAEFSSFHANNAWSFGRNKSALNDEYVGSNHEYVGIGSGAFSFLDGRLLINAFNLNDYAIKIKNEQSPVIASCDFDGLSRLKYLFLTELFDGKIEISKFNQKHNANILKSLKFELFLLKIAGAVKISQNFITPTEFGQYLCVILMKEFYTGMDKVRAIFKDDEKIKTAKKLKIMSEI